MMLKRHQSIILTMESEDGLPYLAPYATSKAVVLFFETLSL
jgi:hypothetical protein